MSIADDMAKATKSVTKKWTAQRKREERNSRARYTRSQSMGPSLSMKDVAWDVIPDAYNKASSGGKYPAHARQIFYAARPAIQRRTGRTLESVYFTQHLLPQYINEHPNARDWWIVYDARGRLSEPHTKKVVPLGTLEVHTYLDDIKSGKETDLNFNKAFDMQFPTIGTENRVSAVLFIEKEGFNELFKSVKLAERYDIAIMSSKGQSVVAARRLVDMLCHSQGGVPLLVLHDFDKAGLEIAQSLTQVSDAALCSGRVRYEFENYINVIDLGIRLADVEHFNLESEHQQFKGGFDRHSNASEKEKAFLESNRRVELNAFTSEDFIAFIEAKLEEHDIKKLIPDDEVLETAFRRAYQIALINRLVRDFLPKSVKQSTAIAIPTTLRNSIAQALDENPEAPWDKALVAFADEMATGEGEEKCQE